MDLDEVYDVCLTAHAFNWIENYRSQNRAVYLDMKGGPIVHHFIQEYGLQQVIDDFIAKTISER
jgi:mevalonate pyrophosphate decarboxylase